MGGHEFYVMCGVQLRRMAAGEVVGVGVGVESGLAISGSI